MVNPNFKYTIVANTRNDENPTASFDNKVTAEAIFQKCDDANANGQLFSKEVLSRALSQLQPEIEQRHFLGELDHPDDIEDINRIATVSLKNVSHVITKLAIDGEYVVGRFETLDTPSGSIFGALLRDNIKVGVSIRAITEQDISYDVNDVNNIRDFQLISYDAVHNPAYSDAYCKTLVASVFQLPNGNWQAKPIDAKSEKAKDEIITMTPDEFKAYTTQLTKAIYDNIVKNKIKF